MGQLLTNEEMQERLSKLSQWTREEELIRRECRFKDFQEALAFVNRVGELAESMDHHPDIFLHRYRFVTLTLTTHSTGKLTQLDFDLAQKIELTL